MSAITGAINKLASSFSRIHQLPRLEAINLQFTEIRYQTLFNGEAHRSLQASLLGALADSFHVHVPSKLMSLYLLNLRTFGPHPLETLQSQTILTTSRRLKLSVVFELNYPDVPVPFYLLNNFWGSLSLRMIPVQMQVILTDLVLHSDGLFGTTSTLSFSELHFPCLSKLSLRDIVFTTTSPGAEDFILRHSTTLTLLELFTCKVLMSNNASLLLSQSESTNLAMDVEWRRRPYWDRIWDRFAAELTSLITLHVDERFSQYVHMIGSSYFIRNTGESRNAADRAALQHFRMTVTTRLIGGASEGKAAPDQCRQELH